MTRSYPTVHTRSHHTSCDGPIHAPCKLHAPPHHPADESTSAVQILMGGLRTVGFLTRVVGAEPNGARPHVGHDDRSMDCSRAATVSQEILLLPSVPSLSTRIPAASSGGGSRAHETGLEDPRRLCRLACSGIQVGDIGKKVCASLSSRWGWCCKSSRHLRTSWERLTYVNGH